MKFPEPELEERRYDLDRAHSRDRAVNLRRNRRAYDGPVSPLCLSVGQGGGVGIGRGAGRLMQSQLLKRFESSWYAALKTVNRMRDANSVMLRVIDEHEAVPTPDVIRDLAGDLGDDTYLSADLIDEGIGRIGGRDPCRPVHG